MRENNYEEFVKNAKSSTLFTAPYLEEDLNSFLKREEKNIKELAKYTIDNNIKHIYWVGSGNSWSNLYSGKYLLDKYSNIPSDYYMSYEFIWRNPESLNKDALVILASYSGATEDTVAALRFANSKNAKTVAITNGEDSPLGKEADINIFIKSDALYILPLAAAYIFGLEIARLSGHKVQNKFKTLYQLPGKLGELYREQEKPMKELAYTYRDEKLFYILASGPLYGIGYKFGYTVFMENMRVHASFMETSEFRHGPVEMLDRENPVMVFLVGSDESRKMSERVMNVCKDGEANIISFDIMDYIDDKFDPLFAPFVLMVPLQWFAVQSSFYRGIVDLDERVVMGRGKLGQGEDITWP